MPTTKEGDVQVIARPKPYREPVVEDCGRLIDLTEGLANAPGDGDETGTST